MEPSVSIRSADLADHTRLTPLFDALDRLHRDGAPWLLRKPERNPRPLEWLHGVLENGNAALFVADAGALVGLASVNVRDAPPSPLFVSQQHAVIDDLVVAPDWQRKGIGARLYSACEHWARQRNVAWLEVNVYEFNAEALDFYTAVGFATSMRRMRKPLAG